MYIPGPLFGKKQFLIETHNAIEISKEQATSFIREIMLWNYSLAIVIVVHCGTHEAAGYADTLLQFSKMTRATDKRRMEFLVMNKETTQNLMKEEFKETPT